MRLDRDSYRRVARAIGFERPDRAPLWPWAFLGCFEQNWATTQSVPLSSLTRHDMAILIGDEGFWPGGARTLSEDAQTRTCIDNWGRTLRERKGAYFEQVLAYPLDADAPDVDALVFEPATADVRWVGFDEKVQAARSAGLYAPVKIGGIYIRAHNLLDEGDLLAEMAGDEQLARSLFAKVGRHLTDMALETLRRADAYDEGLFVYDDMASTHAPMFSPSMFERYLAPEYEKLIAECRRAGCKHFFFHSDGNILPVMDMLLGLGFEGFNPLEPRSVGELSQLRKRFPKAVLLGGICNTEVLPRGDRREIESHVRAVLDLAREGGVVVGTHSIGDDVSPDTFRYLIELIDKYGE